MLKYKDILINNIFFSSKSYDEYEGRVLGHIGTNNSVFEAAYWYDESWPSVFFAPEYGKWYRSKDRKVGVSPFASYMMNKKWTLVEDFTNHMLRFQQVTESSIHFSKRHFNVLGWIDSKRS